MSKDWLRRNYEDIFNEVSRKGYTVKKINFFGKSKPQAFGRIGVIRKMEKKPQNNYYHSILDPQRELVFIGKKRRLRV